ncbi:peptidase S15 [Erwinia sp. OLTSP20]|uniref:CocE/NonD family hydrolase n=1 Tax=unclassified Erwinia TaxID=2622719 RepID=UPI000C1837CC|nr:MULTISPECIES: CocE/NonD family hydrolase [unclassified Erwinia]PIJ49407.1 peptidase S15 [Erwinia sp. OAMSP11]PIJ71083.1 peptidase S15 [Erwinia sp. OLSSP12]PIJ79361.1 peptidase S15 [Erwinia sp. OLCASP19]PIJ80899.1 peptidase S15 [Erwinia sp. OLMTSP26]PIJ83701.1 peptidase S15 [Erwinia sp. OLMDSP33]
MSQSLTATSAAPDYQQIFITLSDGTQLAARLWLPVTEQAVPLVLEWIPYRQSDNTAVGDSMVHGYFAQQGIAALRVDLRGSGNSTGLLRDEYLPQEQDDALEVIEWASRQPWSNGNVGMIGISWGGFAALQVAARRPPALKAIITCCSTDDRYRDDVHYMGGALLTDGLQWGSGLFTQLGRPLDPQHVGEQWRQHWLARLEGMEPPLHAWLAHPQRDAYWRHGSICEDYPAIQCAVLAVGGWTDGYSDAILRMMEHLSAPRKALIGPWTHIYPHWGTPGPAIGFLAECVSWWQQWLQNEDSAEHSDPLLHLWQGENIQPDAANFSLDGHWICAPHWPLPQPERCFWLAAGQLADAPQSAQPVLTVDSPVHCGLMAGEWCPRDGGGSAPEFQHDQRADDALSCCFDSPLLEEALSLLGKASLRLQVAFEAASALLVLRLNEVDAGGRSGRVTFAVHRLTRPQGVAAGEPFPVELALKGVSYRFAVGKRLRLAISTTYWPMVWAEPDQGAVRIFPQSACLHLPLRPAAVVDNVVGFAAAEEAPAIDHQVLAGEVSTRQVHWDAGSDRWQLTMDAQRQKTRIGELTFDGESHDVYEIGRTRDSASMTSRRIQRYDRPGWHIELRSHMHLCWVEGKLQLTSGYEAYENQRRIFQRHWQRQFAPAKP